MSLLENNDGPQTLEEKQAETKQALKSVSRECWQVLLRTYEQGRRLVKDNRYGLTEQEVRDGLGDDLDELDQYVALLKTVINTVAPGTIPTETTPE